MSEKYSTTLNTRSFMYYETKLIADLLYKGFSENEIKDKVLEENILQLPSVDRASKFYHEIIKRLNYLDDYLLENFISADQLTAKALLLYAILKKDKLFFEWMREIIFDKFLIMDMTLSKNETDYFFELKGEQSTNVKNWTSDSKRRLRDAYHQVLKEAGMLTQIDEENYLQHLIIDVHVKDYLIINKEKQLVEVMLGEPLI